MTTNCSSTVSNLPSDRLSAIGNTPAVIPPSLHPTSAKIKRYATDFFAAIPVYLPRLVLAAFSTKVLVLNPYLLALGLTLGYNWPVATKQRCDTIYTTIKEYVGNAVTLPGAIGRWLCGRTNDPALSKRLFLLAESFVIGKIALIALPAAPVIAYVALGAYWGSCYADHRNVPWLQQASAVPVPTA